MLESTLDNYIGKDVIIHIFNHVLDRGILHRIHGKYGCVRDNEVAMLYSAHHVVAIEEVSNEQ